MENESTTQTLEAETLTAEAKPPEKEKKTKRKRPAAKKMEAAPKKPAVRETDEPRPERRAAIKEGEPRPEKRERYFEAVGRRKTAVARVRLYTRSGDFLINDKLYSAYFPTLDLQKVVEDALQKMKLFGRFKVTIKTNGGGIHAQAEAVRHGLARALTKFNPDFRKRLKRAGFLRRDPRMKERKKPGLKKARRAPQWSKR